MEVTLYGVGSNRSARCRWAMQEAGVEYTAVDRRELAGLNKLRRFHSLAKIPAAVTDGQRLFESAAKRNDVQTQRVSAGCPTESPRLSR